MKALCPGSFDPVTHGHLDIITRAAELFDEVLVGVGTNSTKNTIFTPDERVEMLVEAVADMEHVDVELINGLLVEFCRQRGVGVIVKGLRFASDFDYELQMAQMNFRLSGIDTLFIPTAPQHSFLSSSLVREVARFGGDVTSMVPEVVAARLAAKFSGRGEVR